MFHNIRNGCVQLPDGTMDYVSFGTGEKALILLPGLSDGLATVKGKAVLLAAPYRPFFHNWTVYMFSRRNDLPEGWSIGNMAADQVQAMEALGIEKACLCGVSQGGMIAQRLVLDHPEKVEKLVLAVTAPCVNEMTRNCVEEWMRMAKAGDHKSLMIDTAEKSYSEEKLKSYRKFYPLISKAGRPKSYDRFLINARAILAFDASQELGRIHCPTLILGGEEDQIVGAQASRELHEKIAGSRLILYPGLGHAAYEEATDFNRTMQEFLES